MSTSTIDIVRANFGKRTDIQGELREIDEAATTENRAYTDTEQARITELRSELEAVDGRISANLEQETRSQEIQGGLDKFLGVMADKESGQVLDTRSIGERFVSDPGWSEYVSGGCHGKFVVDVDGMDFRSVTDATNTATSAGAYQNPRYAARVGKDFIDRKTYLLDLLPHGTTGDNSVQYIQDTSPLADMANKAVEVTEGSAKPQAGITLAVQTDPVATIAAWANITRQAAADNPQVQSYLNNRLAYSVKRRSDGQVINGDGSLPNLKGLLQRSGISTYAPSGTEARYKSIRHAITVLENVECVPEIIVLNPADAELFDLTNEVSAGIHAQPDDQGLQQQRTAWGLTQVRSTAIASGTALLLDPTACMVWDRQAPTAYMTDSHSTNFTSNILTLLLEARLALTLFDPKAALALTFHD